MSFPGRPRGALETLARSTYFVNLPRLTLSAVLTRNRRHFGASSSPLIPLLKKLAERPSLEALKWYACGPTVYDSAHLGHARTYVSQDVIRRVLTDFLGQDVIFVMGITDVDDKILQRAMERKEDPRALARRYEADFLADMRALNVLEPSALVRVTEHIRDIIDYIKQIDTNGMAYETSSGVYFDVRAFSKKFAYGKLKRKDRVRSANAEAPVGCEEGQQERIGVDVVGMDEKKDLRDFVLWKFNKPGEAAMSWDSPWGRGRPGWHIECSAMTQHLLGPHLDIHSGGVDLCFPHHTNEIAQSDAFRMSEDPAWVGAWLHTGHLYIKGLKMSKSLKNFISVREFLAGHDADDFRMFCLQRRFDADVDYSESALLEARSLRQVFINFVSLAQQRVHVLSRDGRKRWGAKEFEIMAELARVKVGVRKAFVQGGLDTPEVLRLLRDLVGLGHEYLRQGDGKAEERDGTEARGEVVSNLAAYVAKLLALLGLRCFNQFTLLHRGSLSGADVESLAKSLVDFRARVRAAALEGRRRRPRDGSDVEEKEGTTAALAQRLLVLCDEFRERDLIELGIQVKDTGVGECSWTLASPSSAPCEAADQKLDVPGVTLLASRRPK